MAETPQPFYWLAATVVGICFTILGFLIGKTIATSSLFQQGVRLYEQKDYKGAESAFHQVVERQRSNDMVRLLLGNSLMKQDKLDEAIVQFQELIGRSPKNVDAYLRLGEALIQQGKREEAITALKTARDLFKAQRNPQKADQTDQLLQQIESKTIIVDG